MVDHVDGVLLVIQCGHALAGQFTSGINATVIDEQVACTRRNDAQHLIVALFHQGRCLGLRKRGEGCFQIVIGRDRANGANAAGKSVERAGPKIRSGDGVALSGIEITHGNPFVSVGAQFKINPMGFHFQRIVFDHVVHITVCADHIEHAHRYRLCSGHRSNCSKRKGSKGFTDHE